MQMVNSLPEVSDQPVEPPTNRLADWLDTNARAVLVVFGLLTAGFALANIGSGAAVEASQEPDAAVFDTRDAIDRRLPTKLHTQSVIVEARDGGDVLRAATLAELVTNGQALRSADAAGALAPDDIAEQPLLAERFDPQSGVRASGFLTIAEVVAGRVEATFGVQLADASDDMVKVALADVLAEPATAGLRAQLSAQATERAGLALGREIQIVESPAILFGVDALNAPLGGGQFQIGPSADPVVHRKEAFNLAVEEELRGDQEHIAVWAIAAAANSTSEEQGRTAAPFIVLAVVTAVLIVGIATRSYWAAALTGVGLAVLMQWLAGISALLGIKGGLVIELIVPISMVALGVDFAVHAIVQYRDERHRGARRGFRIGLGGVLAALALAAATDSAAFLSNAASDIESIVHFGFAAAVATVSSFIVLGVMAPLLLSRIDDRLGRDAELFGRFRLSPIVGTVRVAAMSGAATILTLAVSPVLGAGVTLAAIIVNLVLPFRHARRALGDTPPQPHPLAKATTQDGSRTAAGTLGRAVGLLAARPLAVIVAGAALTSVAVAGALTLEGSFEITDFFSADTDFVQSVDKVTEHAGSLGGEPNQIVVTGDLSDPEAWVAIDRFVNDLGDNTALAQTRDNTVLLDSPNAIELLELAIANPDPIELSSGVQITDADADGLPDTAEQIRAVFTHAGTEGIGAAGEATPRYRSDDVRTVIDFGGAGNDATVLRVEVPDPRNLDNIAAAGRQIAEDADRLTAHPAIDTAGATGSGLGRLEVIDAGTRALKLSIPVAVIAVFTVLLVGLRSVRYAIVTTIPMLLVAAWLFGTMALLDIDLNFVTATIGAISIGVGADYAIHMTERYRHEHERLGSHVAAAGAAAESTGLALVTSAVSTAVGFAVLALAPMPLFATFGLLSSLMVTYALVASIVVLPPLLGLVAERDG